MILAFTATKWFSGNLEGIRENRKGKSSKTAPCLEWGVGLVLFVWCHGWAVIGAGMSSGAPAAQSLCQLCVSQGVGMGDGRRARYLKYFFAFKESKKGCCLNVSILESIFLHLQVKSLPLPKYPGIVKISPPRHHRIMGRTMVFIIMSAHTHKYVQF